MPVSRKLAIRLIGGPLLTAALLGILYWGHHLEQGNKQVNYPLLGLLWAVAMVSAYEIQGFGKARGMEMGYPLLQLALFVLFGWWFNSMFSGFHPMLTFGIVCVGLFLWLACQMVFQYGRFTPEAAGLNLFGFVYLSCLGFLLFAPVPRNLTSYYLLFLLAAGKGSDMAAFVAGKSIGKHKMAPVVSPNKTWEGGIAGGIVGTGAGFAVLLATPLRTAYEGVPIAALLFFSLVVTIAGQVGDLVKSALKRWAGVKDSGRILPEFGGMLDMVDSFLLEGPVAGLGTLLLLDLFKGT